MSLFNILLEVEHIRRGHLDMPENQTNGTANLSEIFMPPKIIYGLYAAGYFVESPVWQVFFMHTFLAVKTLS
jgi:hypothetical protein